MTVAPTSWTKCMSRVSKLRTSSCGGSSPSAARSCAVSATRSSTSNSGLLPALTATPTTNLSTTLRERLMMSW